MKARKPEYSVLTVTNGAESAYTLRDLLLLVYSKRRAAVLIFLSVFLLVAAVTGLMPKSYVATAKLLLQKGRADNIVSPADDANSIVKPDVNEQMLNSEIEILKSTILLRDVVRAMGLDRRLMAAKEISDQDSAIEMAVGGLKQNLDARAVPKSAVILVQYESDDPEFAARLVNETCRLYVDRHLEVRESRGIFAFYQKQAEMLSDTLLILKEQLQAYEKEFGLVEPQQQRELTLQQLTEYEKELEANRAAVFEAQRRVEFLDGRLASEPKRIQNHIRMVHNSVLAAMHNELDSLEAMYRTLMNTPRSSTGEEVQKNRYLARSLKARIAQAEEAILRSEHSPADALTSDISNSMQSLSEELTRAKTQLVGLQARQKTLANAVAITRQKLERFEQASLTHDSLKRKWELAQNNYFHYIKKQEEARLAEALDREKVANVSILDAASVPIAPVRPNVKLNLAIGFVLAVLFGLGGAIFLGFIDDVVRSRADVERLVDVPVLAAVPENYWMAGMLNSENFDVARNEPDLKTQLKQLDIPIISDFTAGDGESQTEEG